MVQTFSEPAIRSVDDEPDAPGVAPVPPAGPPSDGLMQQVERLRRIIDELAAVLPDVD
jgi:hypothetical protein